MQGLSDLITENEDGVSVMTYMRSLYPGDWNNFLERLGPRLKGIDPASISEEDFCAGGSLEDLQMDVQLWASYRGQLLARTVRGAAPGLIPGYSWVQRFRHEFLPRAGTGVHSWPVSS